MLLAKINFANYLILANANCAFVKLAIIFVFVIIICIFFTLKFLSKTLINIVFVALAIKILLKLTIAYKYRLII